MELTRRDAVAALAAVGGTATAGVGLSRLQSEDSPDEPRDGPPSDQQVTETMVAIAEVLYPTELSGVEPFVEEFLEPRLAREEHARGIRESVAELEERAESWHGGPVTTLSAESREQLLREVGAHTVEEHPAGTTAEQLRYYVVNELLLALYASPKGGELVGLENPQGHPGGTESYQQGPR
ncbi:MAG: gluconate 2-dehydrogenase subunit 3 family protein [Halovenus sp.]